MPEAWWCCDVVTRCITLSVVFWGEIHPRETTGRVFHFLSCIVFRLFYIVVSVATLALHIYHRNTTTWRASNAADTPVQGLRIRTSAANCSQRNKKNNYKKLQKLQNKCFLSEVCACCSVASAKSAWMTRTWAAVNLMHTRVSHHSVVYCTTFTSYLRTKLLLPILRSWAVFFRSRGGYACTGWIKRRRNVHGKAAAPAELQQHCLDERMVTAWTSH